MEKWAGQSACRFSPCLWITPKKVVSNVSAVGKGMIDHNGDYIEAKEISSNITAKLMGP